jgi:hypothetical protein
MFDILAAALGAAGAFLAAVFGSQLLTREGRLTGRLHRLGLAHSVLPDSEERHDLERYVLLAAAELNDWIDPGQVARRWLVRILTFALFVAAVAALGHLAGEYDLDFGATTVLGLLAGALVGIVSLVIATLLQRFVHIRKAEVEIGERLERFKKGEGPTSSTR